MRAYPLLIYRLAALLMVVAGLAACATPPPGSGASVAPPAPTAAPATAAPTAAATPEATTAPTSTATAAPNTPTPPPPTSLPTRGPQATATPAAMTATPAASEILFLRGRTLTAYDTAARSERRLADDVSEFAATPDGTQIALVRGSGSASELWLVARDGSGLRQLTSNGLAEGSPSWAPDGLTLAYASSAADVPHRRDWFTWSAWCAAAEVRKLDLAAGAETTLAAGCDPAFAPDGRRIAYAAPPTAPESGLGNRQPLAANSVRLINRQGQNGWDFARAQGVTMEGPAAGRVVYAPAWSPDGARVVYHRFVGVQVETDVNLSEIAGSFEGRGQPLAPGAGWLLPAAFAPDGRMLVITEHNYGDPRGFGGYDSWSAAVTGVGGTRTVAMPSGEVTMLGTAVGDSLARAQRAVWAPDGSALAVQLPPGWRPGLPDTEPFDPSGAEQPGEVWRWRPGAQPEELLIAEVDFASPLAWLPPAPGVFAAASYRLVAPSGWQLAAPTEFEERTAVAADSLRLISAAPFAPIPAEQLSAQTAAGMFPAFVEAGGKDEAPITWPDGSVYREFSGTAPDGTPVAGATRIVPRADGSVVALYRSTPERWPLERALAQALLAASGPSSR